jgi:AcrR family transcriptional regulator
MVISATNEDGRRQRRRRETIDEIRQAALEAMSEVGVAGMSLSDVARRIGIRPPSLYVYFPNKLALYDDLFALGFRRMNENLERARDPTRRGLDVLRHGMQAYIRWCVANPVLAQLMFWRPVPGFQPSDESYRLSVANVEFMGAAIAEVVAAGGLSEAALSQEALALLSVVGAGLISQQLANDPSASFTEGRFSRYAGEALDMWIAKYLPVLKEPQR